MTVFISVYFALVIYYQSIELSKKFELASYWKKNIYNSFRYYSLVIFIDKYIIPRSNHPKFLVFVDKTVYQVFLLEKTIMNLCGVVVVGGISDDGRQEMTCVSLSTFHSGFHWWHHLILKFTNLVISPIQQ